MNVIINNAYPAVQLEATEASSVYHEIREVTLSAAQGSQMYETYNAEFDASGTPSWTLYDTSLPAYATVQDPDGTIHYYSMPAGSTAWTVWEGSGNNTVYNAVDYGLIAGTGVSATQQAKNVTALQNAINAAIGTSTSPQQGGTVVIPAGIYELSGTVTIPGSGVSAVSGGLVIRGESTGTTLVQQGVAVAGVQTAVDIFDISNAGNPGQWGVRFRDLTLQYASGLTVPTAGAVAINLLSGVADTTAEYCGFVNCPQAFAAGSSGSALHAGLVGCTVYQHEYSNSTQIILSGPECFVLYSELYQTPMTDDGPTGCTGIAVGNGAVACRIFGCHISDFYTGVSIGGGSHAQFTRITDCEINAAVAVNIVPPSDTGLIYGVYVAATSFAMLSGYTPTTPTSGVYIDTNGGANSNVEGIFLVDCLAYGYENAGVQINAGQDITISGGKYSSNGTAPGTAVSGAGIAITGTCDHVLITGADCSGVFDFVGGTQPYGVSVATGASNISVTNCDLTGNATGPLNVPTNGTDLRVTDCPGYNDQGTVVSSTAPPSGTHFNGGYFGYYGPTVFFATGTISQIAIQGNNTHLLAGTFTLAAGAKPYATLTYSIVTGLDFLMIGQ